MAQLVLSPNVKGKLKEVAIYLGKGNLEALEHLLLLGAKSLKIGVAAVVPQSIEEESKLLPASSDETTPESDQSVSDISEDTEDADISSGLTVEPVSGESVNPTGSTIVDRQVDSVTIRRPWNSKASLRPGSAQYWCGLIDKEELRFAVIEGGESMESFVKLKKLNIGSERLRQIAKDWGILTSAKLKVWQVNKAFKLWQKDFVPVSEKRFLEVCIRHKDNMETIMEILYPGCWTKTRSSPSRIHAIEVLRSVMLGYGMEVTW